MGIFTYFYFSYDDGKLPKINIFFSFFLLGVNKNVVKSTNIYIYLYLRYNNLKFLSKSLCY